MVSLCSPGRAGARRGVIEWGQRAGLRGALTLVSLGRPGTPNPGGSACRLVGAHSGAGAVAMPLPCTDSAACPALSAAPCKRALEKEKQ